MIDPDDRLRLNIIAEIDRTRGKTNTERLAAFDTAMDLWLLRHHRAAQGLLPELRVVR